MRTDQDQSIRRFMDWIGDRFGANPAHGATRPLRELT